MAFGEKINRSELEVALLKYGAWALLSFLIVLLILIIGGPYMPETMRRLGLDWMIPEEGGIYADCSKSSNKNNPYCGGSGYVRDEKWRGLSNKTGGSNPFGINE